MVALKQNRPRSDGSASGLAALRIQTENQRGEPVLDFHRCPMLPLRDPVADDRSPGQLRGDLQRARDPERVRAAVPDWRYDALRSRIPPEAADPSPGTVFAIEGRDTVTSAPELARLTLNLAMTHRDPDAGAHGRRLVYGGLTISIAAAAAATALPGLATIVAWRSCEHSAPVFEGDVLSVELELSDRQALDAGSATLADLRAVVHADRGSGEPPDQVLDWRFLGVLA